MIDKEVVLIDKEEYVKVLNPEASGGRDQPKYLYIPVNEYLARKEDYRTPLLRVEEGKREYSVVSSKPSSPAEESLVASFPQRPLSLLKKKVVVTYFDDRTKEGEEVLGDWVAEKLMREVNRRSLQILFVDYQMIKEFLEKREVNLKHLEAPPVLQLLNEVFGVHALVLGQLSGPYVFTSKTDKEKEGTASAIIKIDLQLIDTLSGKTLKNLSAHNPIIAVKESGSFSEEKAKVKAIDLTLSQLGRSLATELDSLEWFCRIAKVEGERIYINAGKLTGLKIGDVMEVISPTGLREKREAKGQIKILDFFGIDASSGRLIHGKSADVNDILRMVKREGT